MSAKFQISKNGVLSFVVGFVVLATTVKNGISLLILSGISILTGPVYILPVPRIFKVGAMILLMAGLGFVLGYELTAIIVE